MIRLELYDHKDNVQFDFYLMFLLKNKMMMLKNNLHKRDDYYQFSKPKIKVVDEGEEI